MSARRTLSSKGKASRVDDNERRVESIYCRGVSDALPPEAVSYARKRSGNTACLASIRCRAIGCLPLRGPTAPARGPTPRHAASRRNQALTRARACLSPHVVKDDRVDCTLVRVSSFLPSVYSMKMRDAILSLSDTSRSAFFLCLLTFRSMKWARLDFSRPDFSLNYAYFVNARTEVDGGFVRVDDTPRSRVSSSRRGERICDATNERASFDSRTGLRCMHVVLFLFNTIEKSAMLLQFAQHYINNLDLC